MNCLNLSNRKYVVDEDYFEKIDSEEKAYWLGFLYADGTVRKRRSGELRLKLAIKDLAHLEKFQKALCSTSQIKFEEGKVKYKDGYSISKCCTLYINSNKLVGDLMNKGCVQNKTLILKFPNEDIVPKALIHHFVRGYFDGDGCIRIIKAGGFQFQLLGTESFLGSVKNIFCDFINFTKNTIIKEGNIHRFYVSGKKVFQVKEFLYNNSSIYLNRKKDIFNSIENPLLINKWKAQ